MPVSPVTIGRTHASRKTDGIVQVSKGGRGFVVAGRRERFVITAAHCLPKLPPCTLGSLTEERTYTKLLGPLGGKCTAWAECLYADPVADLAVLCSPDDRELWDEAVAYEVPVGGFAPLRLADLPLKR